MAQVTVQIDGKAYRMACEEGQEDHLTGLAGQLDRYVGHLKSQFGEIGDLRITVMAGIMVMDELAEANRQLAETRRELDALRQNREAEAAARNRTEHQLTGTLSELTDRLNGITARLTQRPQGPAN